jgi:glucose-6-phosphate 1-dehydrogenase
MLHLKYPSSIIIFGAKGDLTRRKLIPALYNLFLTDHLPANYQIICVDYVTVVEKDFKNDLLSGVNEFSRTGKPGAEQWNKFAANIKYLQGDFLKADTFNNLKNLLTSFEKNNSRGIRMFYFAVAPRFIEIIADALYKHTLCNQDNLHRMVVEKPFGNDLQTAQKLNKFLRKRFSEKQIYRIDHYLGKETVQNIMAFRFANYIFEPLWNRNFIDHVQISMAEQVSIGKRGGYYDASGALRDMVQNHLLQLLCVTAMECPHSYNAETIRNSKVQVLKNIRPFQPLQISNNIIRAQYTAGKNGDADQMAYRKEENVSSSSVTETFVAAKFFIDNKRWKGVPFFLRTGKCLPKQSSVIVIQFKDSPHKIFKNDIEPNRLVISIQPEQEISLLFESKIPGLEMKFKNTEMDFTYKDSFTEAVPEAYETLLLDILQGDATLFMRADQVEQAWKIVMPIINSWKKNPKKQLHFYKAGSWGPVASKQLLKGYAKEWYMLPS